MSIISAALAPYSQRGVWLANASTQIMTTLQMQNDGFSDPKNALSFTITKSLMLFGKKIIFSCRDFDENSQLMMGFHAQFLTIHQYQFGVEPSLLRTNKFQLGHITRHSFFPFVTLNCSCTCSIIIKVSADRRSRHICKLTLHQKPIIFPESRSQTVRIYN